MGVVNGRVPGGLVDGGVDHLLEFPQGLPHHMDVRDLQEAQLHVGVKALALISAIFGLVRTCGAGEIKRQSRAEQEWGLEKGLEGIVVQNSPFLSGLQLFIRTFETNLFYNKCIIIW